DQLLEAGLLTPTAQYKQVVVRGMELSRSRLPPAHAASKLNRDPLFIQSLIAHGEQQAGGFLAPLALPRAWAGPDGDAGIGLFADDCELVSAPPFSAPGRHRGSGPVRQLVRELLSAGVRVDLTRKLLAREQVTWTLRTRDEDGGTGPSGPSGPSAPSGQAEA